MATSTRRFIGPEKSSEKTKDGCVRVSASNSSILSATVTTSRDRVAVSRFTFEMGDPKHLGHVLRAVRLIDGVYDVYRITS